MDFCKVLRASDARFQFRIHGDGGAAGEVRAWVDAEADARFAFGPLLDEPGFVAALHDADLYVVTEKAGSGASFFPSKMVPCLASGTPSLVVSGPESPLGREAATGALGPWFDWDRCGDAPGLIASLGDHPDRFSAWQRAALRRAHSNDRERCLDLIERTFGALIAERARPEALRANPPMELALNDAP